MSDFLSVIISVCQCSFCNFFSVSYSNTISFPFWIKFSHFRVISESFPSHYRVILEPLSRDNLHLSSSPCSLFTLHLVPFLLLPCSFSLVLFYLPCSFFLPPKGTTLTSTLCLFYIPCVFFTQNLFQKRNNPCFFFTLSPSALMYLFSFYFTWSFFDIMIPQIKKRLFAFGIIA